MTHPLTQQTRKWTRRESHSVATHMINAADENRPRIEQPDESLRATIMLGKALRHALIMAAIFGFLAYLLHAKWFWELIQ